MSNVDASHIHRCTDHCSEGHTYTLPGCAHPSAKPANQPLPAPPAHNYNMPHDMRYASNDPQGCPPGCPYWFAVEKADQADQADGADERPYKPSWDDYFLGIAQAVAHRSGCHRANVGAVIVSPDRIIEATGYNDAPPGRPGCDNCPHRLSSSGPGSSAYEPCVAVHAEANAIIYAGRSGALDSTIYITTEPCASCEKLIQAAGITRIVCPDYTQTVVQPHTYEGYRQRFIPTEFRVRRSRKL